MVVLSLTHPTEQAPSPRTPPQRVHTRPAVGAGSQRQGTTVPRRNPSLGATAGGARQSLLQPRGSRARASSTHRVPALSAEARPRPPAPPLPGNDDQGHLRDQQPWQAPPDQGLPAHGEAPGGGSPPPRQAAARRREGSASAPGALPGPHGWSPAPSAPPCPDRRPSPSSSRRSARSSVCSRSGLTTFAISSRAAGEAHVEPRPRSQPRRPPGAQPAPTCARGGLRPRASVPRGVAALTQAASRRRC